MADVTNELLAALAPEYAAMSAERLLILNRMASVHVSDYVFGDNADLAKTYVVAHLAKLADTGGAGAVRSESIGDMSKTYAVPAEASYWNLTSYGQEFLQLCNKLALDQGDLYVSPPTFTEPEE